MPKPLFIAKITRPVPSGVLRRPRLFRELDVGRKKPVIWIAGPAGSGKSTLIASYLNQKKLPCLWYQVDESDADIASFFYYLGCAAKKAAPKFRKFLPLLTPEYMQGLPLFTHRFFEELYKRLKSPCAIVFDNYQKIAPTSSLHAIINIGLSIAPEGINIIFLSRNEPPAALAHLRAGERIHIIGWQDIRFTLDETQELVRAKGEARVPGATLQHMHQQTEGWAAGLVLMMQALKTGGFDSPAMTAHAPRDIFDYFASEVLDALDSETRDFLMMTSFLPKMTTVMAEKLTGQYNAGRILIALNQGHFFTEKHGTDEPSYQYHSLFRRFLLTRVTASLSNESIVRLKKRAAAVLEEECQIEEAAVLYHEAGEWNGLAKLMITNAPMLMKQGRLHTLDDGLSKLPDGVINQTPWGRYWLGTCKLFSNSTESRRSFEKAYNMFKQNNDVQGCLLSWVGIIDAIFCVSDTFRDVQLWIQEIRTFLKRNPSFPDIETEAAFTSKLFQALTYTGLDDPKLPEVARKALVLLEHTPDENHAVMLGAQLLVYYAWKGDCAAMQRIFHDTRSMAHLLSVSPLARYSWFFMESIYYWYTADAKKTFESVRKARKIADDLGAEQLKAKVTAQAVYAALSEEDVKSARAYLDAMRAMVATGQRMDSGQYEYAHAYYSLVTGDMPDALRRIRVFCDIVPDLELQFLHPLMLSGLAQVQVCMKDYVGALSTLEEMHVWNKRMASRILDLKYDLIMAQACFGLGEDEKARKALTRGFLIGREQGIYTIDWWLPKVMAELCAKALEYGIEIEYVQTLIKKRGLVSADPASVPENWPWPLRINVLGRFELVVNGGSINFSGKVQKKPLAMLKALIAFGGTDVTEEQITDALWPDADGDTGRLSFKTTLRRLRDLLGKEEILLFQEGRLSLNRRCCSLDVWSFEKLLASSSQFAQSGNGRDLLEKALALYRGRFLEGEDDKPWAISLRERLQSRFLRGVIALGESWEREDNLQQALEWYHKGLEIEDLSEEIYQRLMFCYRKKGCIAEAIKTYDRCCRTFSAVLGIEPSEKTKEIYATLRR